MLEMRSTERMGEDIRYRSFTTSKKTAERFRTSVTKIQFSDSGHGIVPSVTELEAGAKRKPKVATLIHHVHDCMHPKRFSAAPVAKKRSLADLDRLLKELE